MIAAFNVPYGPEAKSISRPDTLEIVTIDPAPPSSRYGSAASTRPTVPIRSTSKLARQFSALSGMASALTLATTPSSPPSASAAPETHAASAAASATSTAEPIAVAPPAVSAAWASADRLRGARAVGDGGALGQQPFDDGAADAARAAGDGRTACPTVRDPCFSFVVQ